MACDIVVGPKTRCSSKSVTSLSSSIQDGDSSIILEAQQSDVSFKSQLLSTILEVLTHLTSLDVAGTDVMLYSLYLLYSSIFTTVALMTHLPIDSHYTLLLGEPTSLQAYKLIALPQ